MFQGTVDFSTWREVDGVGGVIMVAVVAYYIACLLLIKLTQLMLVTAERCTIYHVLVTLCIIINIMLIHFLLFFLFVLHVLLLCKVINVC